MNKIIICPLLTMKYASTCKIIFMDFNLESESRKFLNREFQHDYNKLFRNWFFTNFPKKNSNNSIKWLAIRFSILKVK